MHIERRASVRVASRHTDPGAAECVEIEPYSRTEVNVTVGVSTTLRVPIGDLVDALAAVGRLADELGFVD